LSKACSGSKIRGAVRVILTALAVPGFALGLAIAAGELVRGDAPVYRQPTSIVWADRVYSNKHDLDAWLRSRGASYATWAARHPGTAAVLEGRRARKLAKGQAPARSRRLVSASPRSADSSQPVLAIGLVVASTLGLLALTVMLRDRLPRLALARSARAGPRRTQWAGFARRVALPSWGATIARLVDSSRSASHHARAGLERRVTQSAAAVGQDSLLARKSLRRHAPDIALYVTSVLLAVVVGASLALYLN
jgi:hypothetical protein